MTVSTLQSQSALFWPLLHVAEDSVWHDNNEAFQQVFAYLNISDKDLKQTYKKTGDLIMQDRTQFALNTFRLAGVIERRRRQYCLSINGQQLMKRYDWKTASYRIIMHLPQYKDVVKQLQQKHKSKLERLQSQNQDFQTKIDSFVKKYNQNVKQQLLAKLQVLENPTDLESIMVKLLEVRMGFQL